ncbi:MAG: CpaF family protein [Oscillospiraceae bacterium]|nr:CpaF family protein [Oscillospiraceae bacterium]
MSIIAKDVPREEVTDGVKKYINENLNLNELTDDELYNAIEKAVKSKTRDTYMSISEQVDITENIFSSIRGLGILDIIMKDDTITEVMINGYDHIYVEKNGVVKRLGNKFESKERLEDIIQRIVSMAGREVNQANPIVDTRLPDGSRVNVVLPPVSLCGPVVTIRKFSSDVISMDQLIKLGAITAKAAEMLEILVRAKYNIFISGGTGSGKTTFLNALSNFIPYNERVITIEDSAELQIRKIENLVSMETRNANSTGAGEITIRDLIRSSLRMRPERIIVGEVRGPEALDMLQAMNTGHDGSLSTGHANSAEDMMRRLETMVLTGAEGLPLAAVRQQIASAVDIVVHLSRMRDHSRKVTQITEIIGTNNGEIVLNPLYDFAENEYSTIEKVEGALVRTENKFICDTKLKLSGIKNRI